MTRRLVLWVAAVALLGFGRAAPSLLAPEPTASWTWAGPAGCEATERAPDQWRPLIANADRHLDATYRCDDGLVAVHVGEFFGQGPGKEAVGGRNRVADTAPRQRWAVDGRISGLGFDVNAYRFVNPHGQDVIVWQWYSVGPNPTANATSAKFAEALQLLKLDPPPSAQFLVAVVDPPEESGRLERLLGQSASSLWAAYREGRP